MRQGLELRWLAMGVGMSRGRNGAGCLGQAGVGSKFGRTLWLRAVQVKGSETDPKDFGCLSNLAKRQECENVATVVLVVAGGGRSALSGDGDDRDEEAQGGALDRWLDGGLFSRIGPSLTRCGEVTDNL